MIIGHELLKDGSCLLLSNSLGKDCNHRVGTSDSSQHLRRTAHVDVIGQTRSITIACLDNGYVARERNVKTNL